MGRCRAGTDIGADRRSGRGPCSVERHYMTTETLGRPGSSDGDERAPSCAHEAIVKWIRKLI